MAWTAAGCTGDDGTASTSETSTGSEEESTDPGTTTESETGDEPDPNLIEIPGATFMMGCGADDTDCDPDNPEHEVTVSTFMIERTEVTVAAYNACVDAGACEGTIDAADCNWLVMGRDEHPINCVTWQQAVDYCTFMGRRLPTEAEWELAAAGPNNFTFPWGSAEASCTFAHMFQMSGDTGGYGCLTNVTSLVENYEDGASVAGVLQLAGNVDEWVADWYAADYYESGETMDPQGPADGTAKVNRGGDMYDASPLNLRVFERRQTPPDQALPERGFRCAL
jgi:sulfatase modifying factor 1